MANTGTYKVVSYDSLGLVFVTFGIWMKDLVIWDIRFGFCNKQSIYTVNFRDLKSFIQVNYEFMYAF